MSNSDGVSLLAFLKKESDIEAMRGFAEEHNLGEDSVFQGDISDATEYLANHEPPNLLVVEVPSRAEAEGLLDKLADVCSPETRVVIAGNINEYTFFMWLQEIGIFHYLLLPLNRELLEGLYAKAIATPEEVAAGGKPLGKTIGIMGTRGGSGATSLSILLAAMMAEHSKKNCGVIELDPMDGTAALLLDVEPSHGLRDAIEKPDRIDELFLERVIIRMNDHLGIISAEEDINVPVAFSEEAAEALLPVLKERFAYSFLDISHHFNPFSLKAARLCDHLFVVSPMNLQGLRDAMRIHSWLKEKCEITHHKFIANKIGQMAKHEIIKNDFEKSLGEKLITQLPFSPEIFSEITNDLNVIKKTNEDGYDELVSILKLINPSLKIGEESDKKDKKSKKPALKKK